MQPVIEMPRIPRQRAGVLGWLTAPTYAATARRKALLAYLFVLPTVAGILVFTAVPVVWSLGLSLFKWDVISPAQFVGLANYHRFAVDPDALISFGNTAIYVVLDVTLQIAVGLILALAMQRRMARWLRNLFRSAFFLPLITSGAAVSVVMAYLFNKELGVVNYYLSLIGVGPVPWLDTPGWAMITVVLTSVWQQMGFTFLLFTGGLASISREIMEAADVDGATGWRRLWAITLPMLSPTMLFATVVAVIGALQVFTEPTVLTNGGPGNATLTAVMVIYRAAFRALEIGYASAIAALLFLVILSVTAFQFWFSKRWVFYQ